MLAGVGHEDVDERGVSLSAMVAVVLVALFLVAGLVIDGGAKVRASREAEVVAAQVARAGSDAGAAERVVGRDGSATALTAARAALARHPEVAGEVSMAEGQLRVTTSTSAETTFLSLLGINRVHGRGSAVSELRAR